MYVYSNAYRIRQICVGFNTWIIRKNNYTSYTYINKCTQMSLIPI